MRSRVKLNDIDTGKTRIVNDIRKTKGQVVKVGIQGKEALEPKKDTDGQPTPLTLVEIATIHEFGSSDETIPERSFLRATYDAEFKKYRKLARDLQARIIEGKVNQVTALGLIGQQIVGDVQKRIRDGIPPALAASTLRAKTVNGRTGTTPLIETGQLIQSIREEVVKK